MFFNEASLREDIVKVFGPAGAHIDVFDSLVKERDRLSRQRCPECHYIMVPESK